MQFYVDTTKENFINIRKKHTFERIRLSYDEDPYFLVQQILDRYPQPSHRFILLRASKTYPSRYDIDPSWSRYCFNRQRNQFVGLRADPGSYAFISAPTNRPTVLALSATTCEQVTVSPETAMGCRRIRFLQAERGDYCTLDFNNLINQYYKNFTIPSHTTSQINKQSLLAQPTTGNSQQS